MERRRRLRKYLKLFQHACKTILLFSLFVYTGEVLAIDGNCHKEDEICTLRNKSNEEAPKDIQSGIEKSQNHGICRYYLAPSSIPNAGWGMFTTTDIDEGETLFQFESVIPLLDVITHNHKDFVWMLDSYTWQPDTALLQFEANNVDAFIPGIGALPNCFSYLNNVAVFESGAYDDCGLHRRKDPGAGAFSYHIHDRAIAKKVIAAGTELFVDYGEKWFLDRSHIFGMIPLAKDYRIVDTLMGRLINLKNQNTGSLSNSAISDLWNLTQQISSEDPRTINAFKLTNGHDLQDIHSVGTAQFSLPNSKTTVGWIEENGLCIDNLRPSLSNIPQAGRGAFATRSFSKGEMVAPAPLIHITDKKELDMYDLNAINMTNDTRGNATGKQLLLNYCYTHTQSTILLCPYGSAVNLINHDSFSPNVRIRWSNFAGTMTSWLDNPIKALEKQRSSGLMFEFEAIRDIMEGEEIMMDYGKEWEEAWNKHVSEFFPFESSYNYTSAFELSGEKVIRTEIEQRNNPYPSNILLLCKYTNLWSDEVNAPEGYVFTRSFRSSDMEGTITPCEIISRETINGEDYYTANILNSKYNKENIIPEGETHHLSLIPRHAIKFEDVAYTSDTHLTNAFRHPIGIPDDIFPPIWMNLENTS